MTLTDSIIVKVGKGQLTNHAKRMIARSMYVKGNSFLASAVLLRQEGGDEYVVLHLLCQGIEITLKALLLFRDYDKYKNKLKKPLGHDLNKLIATVSTEFDIRPMPISLKKEVEKLNSLYSNHWLRYGGVHDILVNPQTIPSDLIFRRINAVVRLSNRYIK